MIGEGALERAPDICLSTSALFLDLDGTLACFEVEPSRVGPHQRRDDILRRLAPRLSGRLAIISGRPIEDIDRILQQRVEAVAGVHGLERRFGTTTVKTERHSGLTEIEAALVALAADHPGLMIEQKGLSVALHFRARPDLAAHLNAVVRRLQRADGIVLQRGKDVWEFLTPGPNKGDAVRAFMQESPFAGARPVYVGDDLTDESAFRAARALGGFGVQVGTPRSTAAVYGLDGVDDVLDWLESLLRTTSARTRQAEAAYV